MPKVPFREEIILASEEAKNLLKREIPYKDYIEITKRISEIEFSKRLKNLNPDDDILMK
ncbi:MAG: hypothetical protein NC817_00585 [Candidatus Omnitrophica bacterium]|nr:hypothetical protein [Candidatus Omnitrophota bacterium]MCM8824350.1 hypothetical protein [Candidatus Omnitrophota bacterium]MCM8827011.1 hypothetical protein [Candidatus Omnitrophota bacterium]